MDQCTEYEVAGLEHEAEIIIDEWGIPHIYAQSQPDVFFVQGFNAARDRLFQMDLWRRRGLGELAEVFGSEHVEQDRAARLFLYRGDMRAEWEAYGSDTKAVASAFVTGINAYVSWASGDASRLPPEFALLGYGPSFWEPEDIAIMRSHGLFHNAEQELARALTLRDFGVDAENLRRTREPDVQLHVADGIDLGKLSNEVLQTYRLALSPVTLTGNTGNLKPSIEPDGSNNWVISGTRTSTGRPILANDPHRSVTLPSLRYIAHLSAPGLDVIGGGEPGLPGISIGHNGNIAFGLTIFAIDHEDLYVYETDPEDSMVYSYDGGWERMRLVTETIHISGQDGVDAELRFTRHGPVIFEDAKNNIAVALRAAWLEPGMAPYLGSMDYMKAQSCENFVAAMKKWGSPGENQVYASPDGTIGWQPAGLIPIRPNWDGTTPVPGDGGYEWAGFYDLDILPNVKNPERGWIATANENNLPASYPNDKKTVTYDWSADTRYRRIAEVLDSNDSMSIHDCVALQTDYVSLPAREIGAILRRLPLSSSDAPAALRLLQEWDGCESVDSAAAALFEVWYRRHMRPRLIREFLHDSKDPGSGFDEVLKAILPKEDRSSDPRTDLRLLASLDTDVAEDFEKLSRILDRTLTGAVNEINSLLGEDMESWSWGNLHHAQLFHPFYTAMSEPRPEWAKVGPLPRGGSGDTPGASAYASNFNQTFGSTFRVVIDVGQWDNSVAMNSPGQSGDPRSGHYADLFPQWAKDMAFPLLYSRQAVDRHAKTRIRLLPHTPASD